MESFTVAWNSVSESFSSVSQPGMHFFSISGSFSARHTVARSCGSSYSPVISSAILLSLFLFYSGRIFPGARRVYA